MSGVRIKPGDLIRIILEVSNQIEQDIHAILGKQRDLQRHIGRLAAELVKASVAENEKKGGD